MVSRFVKLINREWGSVSDAALLLAASTLLSQILALVRDRTFARVVEPGRELDLYYAAFGVPDFLYVSVASLVSVTVLLPMLVSKLNGDEKSEEAKKFFNSVFSVFLMSMIFVIAILFVAMPFLVHFVAPGFDSKELNSLAFMSRIMLLSPLLMGLSTNLFGSVTQMHKQFFLYALSPVFYNIGIIVGILAFYPIFGPEGLALGVVFGAVLHLLLQLPIAIKHKFIPKFTFSPDWSSVYKVFALSLPRTLTLSLGSLTLLVIIAMASFLSEGSISIFRFAFNIQSIPLNLIGVSFSVAAFPTLVRFFSSGDNENFLKHIVHAGRQIIFWSLPAMFLFIVLRAQIVRVLLGSKSFSWGDTRLVAAGLALFSVSIIAQALVLLFVRGYYAAGNTRRPLVINIISSIATIILAWSLIRYIESSDFFRSFLESMLRVSDVSGTEILALPLAYSIGSIFNVLLLWFLFKKDFAGNSDSLLWKTFFRSFAGAFFMGFTAYVCLGILAPLFGDETFIAVLGHGLISGIFGIIVGVLVLRLMRSRELAEFIASLKSKFWKAPIIAPPQEDL